MLMLTSIVSVASVHGGGVKNLPIGQTAVYSVNVNNGNGKLVFVSLDNPDTRQATYLAYMLLEMKHGWVAFTQTQTMVL